MKDNILSFQELGHLTSLGSHSAFHSKGDFFKTLLISLLE